MLHFYFLWISTIPPAQRSLRHAVDYRFIPSCNSFIKVDYFLLFISLSPQFLYKRKQIVQLIFILQIDGCSKFCFSPQDFFAFCFSTQKISGWREKFVWFLFFANWIIMSFWNLACSLHSHTVWRQKRKTSGKPLTMLFNFHNRNLIQISKRWCEPRRVCNKHIHDVNEIIQSSCRW